MSKKMYYNEEEAAAKLGISVDELKQWVSEGKLRAFRDGARNMYQVDQVDPLAKSAGGDTGEIELAPLDTSAGDMASLSDVDEAAPAGKEDTVITAEGISIFDDEDLEIEAADPMAKTQIAQSLEEQISMEGVGSGSGLLDLTRESDDTSLGGVLDQIDIEGGGAQEIGDVIAEPEPYMPSAPEPMMEQPVIMETPDSGAGFFGGLAIGAAIVTLVMAAVTVSVVLDVQPNFVQKLSENLLGVVGGGAAVCVIVGVVGLLVGKSTAGIRGMK